MAPPPSRLPLLLPLAVHVPKVESLNVTLERDTDPEYSTASAPPDSPAAEFVTVLRVNNNDDPLSRDPATKIPTDPPYNADDDCPKTQSLMVISVFDSEASRILKLPPLPNVEPHCENTSASLTIDTLLVAANERSTAPPKLFVAVHKVY